MQLQVQHRTGSNPWMCQNIFLIPHTYLYKLDDWNALHEEGLTENISSIEVGDSYGIRYEIYGTRYVSDSKTTSNVRLAFFQNSGPYA